MRVTRSHTATLNNSTKSNTQSTQKTKKSDSYQSAAQKNWPTETDYSHAMNIRHNGAELSIIQQRAIKAFNSAPLTPLGPGIPLSILARNFYQCVNLLSDAFLLFKTSDSETSKQTNDAVETANAICSAIESANNSFSAALIVGTDDADLEYAHGLATTSATLYVISKISDFFVTMLYVEIYTNGYITFEANQSSSVEDHNALNSAQTAIATAVEYTNNNLLTLLPALLESTHNAFLPATTVSSSYIEIVCKAMAIFRKSCNTFQALSNLADLLNKNKPKEKSDDYKFFIKQLMTSRDILESFQATINNVAKISMDSATYTSTGKINSTEFPDAIIANYHLSSNTLKELGTVFKLLKINISEKFSKQSITTAIESINSTEAFINDSLNILRLSIENSISVHSTNHPQKTIATKNSPAINNTNIPHATSENNVSFQKHMSFYVHASSLTETATRITEAAAHTFIDFNDFLDALKDGKTNKQKKDYEAAAQLAFNAAVAAYKAGCHYDAIFSSANIFFSKVNINPGDFHLKNSSDYQAVNTAISEFRHLTADLFNFFYKNINTPELRELFNEVKSSAMAASEVFNVMTGHIFYVDYAEPIQRIIRKSEGDFIVKEMGNELTNIMENNDLFTTPFHDTQLIQDNIKFSFAALTGVRFSETALTALENFHSLLVEFKTETQDQALIYKNAMAKIQIAAYEIRQIRNHCVNITTNAQAAALTEADIYNYYSENILKMKKMWDITAIAYSDLDLNFYPHITDKDLHEKFMLARENCGCIKSAIDAFPPLVHNSSLITGGDNNFNAPELKLPRSSNDSMNDDTPHLLETMPIPHNSSVNNIEIDDIHQMVDSSKFI